ncbi:MAG: glycosyltransferase [Candidatus Sumerlaeia bacterium]|nr:glycosyltransferase [Candidatus Sumerlaeia bacterium]
MSAARPLVSVVTPCWNAARYLPATYASLRRQTHDAWEWIVADDASTDASLSVLERLAARDARVRVLPQAHAGLPATMRNRALEVARGDVIAFLDADDLWHPQKLERQLACLKRHRDAGLTWSFVQEFWSPEWKRATAPPTFWARRDAPDPFVMLLTRGNIFCTSSLLLRRDAFEAIGPFDEDPDLRIGEDHDFLLRAARRVSFVRTPGVLVRYRLHPGNVTRSHTTARMDAALRQRLEKRGDLHGRARRLYLSTWHLKRAERAMTGDEPGNDPRVELLRAWACNPLDATRWVGAGLALAFPGPLLPRVYQALKRTQARAQGRAASPHRLTGHLD